MTVTDHETRYSRGFAALCEVENTTTPAVLLNLADLAPDLGRMVVEFGYGDVFSRPGLPPRERQLATVGALAAMGNAQPQLKFHILGALNVGATPVEIVEALIHVCVYAGVPASLNALSVAREAFTTAGVEPTPTTHRTATDDRWDVGVSMLDAVDGSGGQQVVDSLADLAPDLGRFVVEFAFGEIYARPGLGLREREIVTVAACVALGTVRPQLKVHVHGLLNTGGTQTELVEIITQMAVYAGFPAALNGLAAAREVLEERDAG